VWVAADSLCMCVCVSQVSFPLHEGGQNLHMYEFTSSGAMSRCVLLLCVCDMLVVNLFCLVEILCTKIL
jgi:hypothetical protein